MEATLWGFMCMAIGMEFQKKVVKLTKQKTPNDFYVMICRNVTLAVVQIEFYLSFEYRNVFLSSNMINGTLASMEVSMELK